MKTSRPEEIVAQFNQLIQNNLNELINGVTDEYLDIHKIADKIHINATHLSNTVKETTGKSPCDICNEKTIDLIKELLATTDLSIADIAFKLTYEPTNFTKYFKKHTGMLPSVYRSKFRQKNT
ncbi:DNA-binding protein [Elizabethkingia miricola]|uniref:AraC family transcriptional regulator n=1 Tax=Elizabethkingia miricola TaxID=172045 RepID=A0ABD5B4A1_ELIMR|nr:MULTISPECIES: AraC family transcriptional regulator [Elizabethkingia]MCL1680741.1 AraC family transcriptional regulator [Elizabethkingia miricola]MDQ8748152.1 AraC family transcriptional regulator [Elizabethkingia miricola]MDX8568628.1 AraC family transcriptional regulator [Elizabethkingia sp. HX XZB]OBS13300.1 DNA-binding protein [Elizabethkingia miricola]OPB86527.1 DNA-binding protein [Elizabethkingia miricola]